MSLAHTVDSATPQACRHLPSFRASLPCWHYQIVLLSDTGKCSG